MHKLNSVFKNMVKCVRVDDFHNLLREKAEANSIYPLTNYFILILFY